MKTLHNKRKILPLLIAAVFLILFIYVLQTRIDGQHDDIVRKLSVKLPLNKDQAAGICYADEQHVYFSVNERNENFEGPLDDTKEIIKYDYRQGHVEKKFEITGKSYIGKIIPYQDGIIYAQYDNALANTEWKINYLDEKSLKTIDFGKCTSYDAVPSLGYIDDTIVYSYEDVTDGYSWGVKKITDLNSSIVFSEKGNKCYPAMRNNGREYCFFIGKDDMEFATMIIGNIDGKILEYYLPEKVNSMALAKNYAVCSVSDGFQNPQMVKVNLLSGEIEVTDSDLMYRLTGGNGERCLFTSYEGDIKSINTNNNVIKELDFPEEAEDHKSMRYFYNAGENKYIVEKNEEEYFLVEFQVG